MKKLSVKKISIFVIVIGIVVSIVYLQNGKNKNETYDLKSVYIEKLSCIPEKPIDKGIIYAEAMKQYWQWQIDTIWYRYEQYKKGEHPLGEYAAMLDAERIKKECGLEKNIFGQRKFTKNTCLPLVIQKNKPLRIYNSEKDTYLYQPENYNKDVDFTVDMRGYLFKEDCCKLLTYDETRKEVDKLQKQDLNIYLIDFDLINNEEILRKVYLLRINYSFYPVSLCGKVPHFAYFHVW